MALQASAQRGNDCHKVGPVGGAGGLDSCDRSGDSGLSEAPARRVSGRPERWESGLRPLGVGGGGAVRDGNGLGLESIRAMTLGENRAWERRAQVRVHAGFRAFPNTDRMPTRFATGFEPLRSWEESVDRPDSHDLYPQASRPIGMLLGGGLGPQSLWKGER